MQTNFLKITQIIIRFLSEDAHFLKFDWLYLNMMFPVIKNNQLVLYI